MDKGQEPSHPMEIRGRPQRSTQLPGEEFHDNLEGREPSDTPCPLGHSKTSR